jgi:hypothetical protein
MNQSHNGYIQLPFLEASHIACHNDCAFFFISHYVKSCQGVLTTNFKICAELVTKIKKSPTVQGSTTPITPIPEN